jgi:ADP-heptose:LPS heptosyltransferase
MKWFLQNKANGLGNFIMATPAIYVLYKQYGPIPVYFATHSISKLYQNCEFISVLKNRPKIKPSWTSTRPKRRSHESDSEALCRIVGHCGPVPPTYIDGIVTKKLKPKKQQQVAVFHGCLGRAWKDKKNLGRKIRQLIIKLLLRRNMIPVILGNSKDRNQYWCNNNLDGCVDYLGKLSLIDSVSVLKQCDFFISNDTGLYHAAGAMEKPGMVIWKATSLIKNKSPFDGIEHIINKKLNVKVIKHAVADYLSKYII